MNELAVRALTGAVYVALTLAAAFAGPFTTLLLFLPVCIIASGEMYDLVHGPGNNTARAWSMIVGGVACLAVALGSFDADWTMDYVAGLTCLVLIVSFTWLLLQGTQDPARELGGLLTVMLFVGLPFGSTVWFFAHGSWLFVGFMLMLWTNDTGAYLVGRTIGRTKLLPAVSPKKTVEGFIGGVLLTMAVGYVLSLYQPMLSMTEWLACGALVGITATLGDLLESALKRARGVKDSGTILPGHGGMLDRFDGFLLAAPVILLYLRLVH
ncbi:MAG: phosphatidate cytidylyltransferase [Flavobacteriales bacterium]